VAAAGINTLTPSQFKAAKKLLGLPGGSARSRVTVKRKHAGTKRSASKHTAAAAKHHGRRHKAGAAGVLAPGSRWLTGMNDVLGTCAAVAVANSLVAAGVPVTDEDAVRLHVAAGGNAEWADPAEVVALAASGFLGPEAEIVPGCDIAVTGDHCVYVAGDFAVSHGIESPWETVPLLSWGLAWDT